MGLTDAKASDRNDQEDEWGALDPDEYPPRYSVARRAAAFEINTHSDNGEHCGSRTTLLVSKSSQAAS